MMYFPFAFDLYLSLCTKCDTHFIYQNENLQENKDRCMCKEAPNESAQITC